MANFDTGLAYVTAYLSGKEASLDGSAPSSWFADNAATMAELYGKFDWKEDDQRALVLHEQTKDPKLDIPPSQERKYRLRTLFQVAGTSAVRQQFLCGPGNTRRGPEQSYRYELSNVQAVRCCLAKFNGVQEEMDKT